MGNPRLHVSVLLFFLVSTSANVQKLQQRPVRTLGSLFGGGSAKPTPPQQPPPGGNQQVQNEQKSLGGGQVVSGGGGVRPLVYQVRYYENQVQNSLDYGQRNYQNAVEKAGVVGEPVVLGGVPQGYVYGQQPVTIPQRVLQQQQYYYNPLIPPALPEPTPTLYTIANIGNTQVLIPCSNPSTEPLILDSTISLNVQDPSTRVNQPTPPAQSTAPQPQRTPIQPPAVHQPLVREQVVQAAQELQYLPGSAIVGANVNSPYTQGSYYYVYYLPPTPQPHQQVQPQLIDPRLQYQIQNPYVNQYRLNQNGVPYVLLNNYGYQSYPQQLGPVVIPQPSNNQPVKQQVQSTQSQTQSQSQQQQQQVKG